MLRAYGAALFLIATTGLVQHAHATTPIPADVVGLGIMSPSPGASGLEPDTQVLLTVGAFRNRQRVTQAAADLGASLELWDITSGTKLGHVLGAATLSHDSGWWVIALKPSAPLQVSHEYGVRLATHPKYSTAASDGTLTHFYVGSRPRVAEVILKRGAVRRPPTYLPQVQATLSVRFSEPMRSTAVRTAMSITNTLTGTRLTLVPSNEGADPSPRFTVVLGASVGWDTGQDHRLRVEASATSAKGAGLDGKAQQPAGTPQAFEYVLSTGTLKKVLPSTGTALFHCSRFGWWTGNAPVARSPVCVSATP
ncbi:MAG: hypothetical protein IT371_09230 [Deltaproteobacteria bacterium]|nr:hypothetical protein [Deltaproteobacteria bacterium]